MATLELGFVLFPNLTQLDFTGPLQVMSRLPNSRVHIAAKTMEIVPSDCNLGLQPTVTFALMENQSTIFHRTSAASAWSFRTTLFSRI